MPCPKLGEPISCAGRSQTYSTELGPWVDYCFRAQMHLLLGAHRFVSARGVQQGDPLGPLLFALATHDAVLRARSLTEQRFPGKLDIVAF